MSLLIHVCRRLSLLGLLHDFNNAPTVLSLDQRLFGAPKNGKLMPTRDFPFLLGRDDPATLTAIMAYGAASIPSASHQAIVLKGRAIRMVNERLAHVDDALIHAISHLWLVEVYTCLCPPY
jgi:hypothetical protein